ncbi:MAG: zf-HC2 domain-containing protein [Burkholderiales bacterium]|nr:zf-HC2 domain-containing protein [Burkholderiales bacterium]MBK9347720.1 zf-HC2 domain-containing protein [Burkholderiales bacterium]
MTLPLMRTCREVATILVAREDRVLSLADRLALRIHMAICDACPRFENQMLTMRNGLRQWRNYTGPDESIRTTASEEKKF